jgi:uncharacterized protein (TIGR01777 family)
MRYIIAGGSGLIGRALSQALLEGGDEVVALSRTPEKARVPAGVQLVGWDGRSPNGWAGLVDGAEGVINLAGESIGAGRWSAEQKQKIMLSREQAAAAIVQAVSQAKKKPEVILQIFGVGYYGVKADEVITEQNPPGDDFLAGLAARLEDALLPVDGMGVRRVVLRSGVVLDRHSGVLPSMMLPFHLFIGGPLGSGKQWVSWIHLADQVQGMIFVLKNQVQGAFNLTSPEPVTNATFGKTLGKVMHRPYWIPAPGFVLKLVLGELSTLILEGQRVIPERLLEAGFRFRFPSLEAALTDLLASV